MPEALTYLTEELFTMGSFKVAPCSSVVELWLVKRGSAIAKAP